MKLWPSRNWEQEQSLQRKTGTNRSETGKLLAPCMTPEQSWMSSGQWLIILTHRLCWTAKTWTPKKEATLHKVKPNYFGVVARNKTWPGEGISFLLKKIHLYTNSIFTEEDTLGMAENSWNTQEPPPPPSLGDRHENKTHPYELMLYLEGNSLPLHEIAFKLQPMPWTSYLFLYLWDRAVALRAWHTEPAWRLLKPNRNLEDCLQRRKSLPEKCFWVQFFRAVSK